MEQVLYKLPDGWEWSNLTDVCTPSRKTIEPNPEEQYNYISLENIESHTGKVISDSPTKGSEISSTKVSFKRGMVLYGKLRPYLNKVVVAKIDGIATTEIIPFECSDAISPDFLAYYLRSQHFVDLAMNNCSGARMPRATTKLFTQIAKVPVTSITEQNRIVEKLDALLTRIDIAIEHLLKSVTLADVLLKNGLAQIFEALRINCEVAALSSVVKINSGIALPKIFKNGIIDGDLPFYKVAQMNNHHEYMVDPEITFNERIGKEHKIKLFPKGSTLIPKRGGAILTNKKRLLLEVASYDSNIMGLKADESKISDDYLFAFMRTIDLANFVDASTIPQINNKHIDQMQIPLASIKEQADVVSRVNLLVKKVETMNSEIQRQLDDLQSLKKSILDSAFKGEL